MAFRVIDSKAIQKKFLRLYRKAKKLGLGPAVRTAVKDIYQHLAVDPKSFGEPIYHLAHAKLEIYVRLYQPLVVHYGIHQDQDLVFIKAIDWLPGREQE